METVSIILMGLSLGIVAVSFFWYGRDSVQGNPVKVTVFETNVRLEWIFVGVVLLAALVIRVWEFGMMPYGMNQDGAMAAIDAKALADHGTDRLGMYMPVHFTAWGYGQMSVLLSYCMIPFVKVFGLNPVTARLPMLIVSMLALYVIYRFMKELTGVTGAQIALVLAAFTPWHFLQSRWALDCNMFPHMMLFGVYFLYRGISFKRRYLYISMLFFALCMYSYGVSFYTVPVFLVSACVYLLVKKRIRIRDMLICIGVYLLVSWPIYLTMMINTFGWETIETPFFTMPFFPDSLRSADILFFSDDIWGQLKDNLAALWRVLMQEDDLPWNTVPGFGTIYRQLLPFMAVGIYVVFSRLIRSLRLGYVAPETDEETVEITGEETAEIIDEEPEVIKEITEAADGETDTAQEMAVFKEEEPVITEAETDAPDEPDPVKKAGYWLLACWFAVSVFCGLITATVNVNRINILMYPMILLAAFGIHFVYVHRRSLMILIAGMLVILFVNFTITYYSPGYTQSMSNIFMGGFGECLQDLNAEGCHEYYIDTRCHSDGSVEVLELQTMFYLEVDAEYYRSEAFSQRFHYYDLESVDLVPAEGVGYVVPIDEAARFDTSRFTVFMHGRYAAAIAVRNP